MTSYPSLHKVPVSPSSPTARRKQVVPPGFRAPPKQRPRIADMTIRELQDTFKLNAKILSAPGASTSTYVERVSAEQAAIQARLVELQGIDTINSKLKSAHIDASGSYTSSDPPTSRTLEAKRKALYQAVPINGQSAPGTLSMQEAMDLERKGFLQEKERQQRLEDKRKRLGIPARGEVLTREEREARIWAFMNHKPTESDLEDDDDEDSDNDDPSTWFVDDQDDGRKGQDIVEPDYEDLSDIIRVDESRIPYSPFYVTHDGE